MKNGLCKTRLLKMRKALKLAQWIVAAGSGVDGSRLSILERGAPPRTSEIEKLTAYYKLDRDCIWPDFSSGEV